MIAESVQKGVEARLHPEAWQQVLARDARASFVYAVATTGIFCRPSCPSRRPSVANALIFADPAAAEAAGFRACLRCEPARQQKEAAVTETLAAYLRTHFDRAVTLPELAELIGYSSYATQRLFARVMGTSPRAYQNALRAERFREELQQGGRVTDAVYDAGFSSASRAHAGAPLGMEAGEYRAQGEGVRIGYTIGDSPLGRMLVAATERGICAVLLGENDADLIADLGGRFRAAEIVEDATLAFHLQAVLAQLTEHPAAFDLPLDLRASVFQMRVWTALRKIPRGRTWTYAQVASAIGSPRAVRAVASACGANPAAIVVPCHRVIGSDGKLTGYRWGMERKRALLELEKA